MEVNNCKGFRFENVHFEVVQQVLQNPLTILAKEEGTDFQHKLYQFLRKDAIDLFCEGVSVYFLVLVSHNDLTLLFELRLLCEQFGIGKNGKGIDEIGRGSGSSVSVEEKGGLLLLRGYLHGSMVVLDLLELFGQ